MIFSLGFLIGALFSYVLLSVKNTKLDEDSYYEPDYQESTVESDIRHIRRMKEIEFWKDLTHDKHN